MVGVEGNIGAGKSTLLRSLGERNPDWLVLQEPVERWAKELAETHADPAGKSARLQEHIGHCLLQRARDAAEAVELAPVVLLERSLEASRAVFTRQAVERGYIGAGDVKRLEELFTGWVGEHHRLLPVHVLVYMVVTPETALERVRRRGRPCEQCLDVGFLANLHRLHEDWLLRGEPVRPTAPVWRVELSPDAGFEAVCDSVEGLINARLAE